MLIWLCVFADLRWVNIHSSDEACKVLRVGNKNRSAASTKMNQSSSRRHRLHAPLLLNCFYCSIYSTSTALYHEP